MATDGRDDGAVPMTPHPQIGSTALMMPPTLPAPKQGPTTFQVVGGFLGAAAVIAAGLAWIGDAVYLRKSEYSADKAAIVDKRENEIKEQVELKTAVTQNTKTATELKKAVDDLNKELKGLSLTRSRHRPPRHRPSPPR